MALGNHGSVDTPAAVEARHLVHAYGSVVALDDVSIRVPAGGSVALVGESGSGKTTLLRCFNRMVEPREGSVSIDGVDVKSQPVEALRRRIGYVQQDGGLLPHWTVQRNVELVPRLRGASETSITAAQTALDLVGLSPAMYATRYPHELSGGQRQRVALARALAARPPLILLDEPFGALDAISRGDLHEAFESARNATNVTTLLVTHDLAEAARLCSELVVMRAGRIEQQGTIQDLYSAPATPYVSNLLERALAGLERLKGLGSEASA